MTAPNDPSIVPLIRAFFDCSPSAAESLWRRFSPALMRIIRRHLKPQLRPVGDSEDFLQAVWKSIFEHRDRLVNFTSDDAVGAYLATIAANKVRTTARFEQAAKRDMSRRSGADAGELSDVVSRDPTPSQHAIAAELKERMGADLNSLHREMLERRAAGETIDEIAERLGVNERTVRRVFERLERRAG